MTFFEHISMISSQIQPDAVDTLKKCDAALKAHGISFFHAVLQMDALLNEHEKIMRMVDSALTESGLSSIEAFMALKKVASAASEWARTELKSEQELLTCMMDLREEDHSDA